MMNVLKYANWLNASLIEDQVSEAMNKSTNVCCPNGQGKEVHIAESELFSNSEDAVFKDFVLEELRKGRKLP